MFLSELADILGLNPAPGFFLRAFICLILLSVIFGIGATKPKS